jgi:hypothetical protein
MKIDDTRVYGRVHDVSLADIHAAIAEDRLHSKDKIYEIEIVSRDEIHLYHKHRWAKANYDIVKRVGRTWRFVSATVIVG